MPFAARLLPIALVAVVAGCGATQSRAPAAAIAPTSATATATASPAPAAAAKDVVAKIDDFEFKPRTLRIAKGTRVTWKNVDAANHTVTFAKGPGDVGNVSEGRSASARFTAAGTFRYVCVYHPSMHGTIIVK